MAPGWAAPLPWRHRSPRASSWWARARQATYRTVKLQEDLSAPVEKGQAVGILTVQSGDTTLAELPLTAAAAVERDLGDLFTRLLPPRFSDKEIRRFSCIFHRLDVT